MLHLVSLLKQQRNTAYSKYRNTDIGNSTANTTVSKINDSPLKN